jgi:hypothetical protein
MATDSLARRSALNWAASSSAVNGELLCVDRATDVRGSKLGGNPSGKSSLSRLIARLQQTLTPSPMSIDSEWWCGTETYPEVRVEVIIIVGR